MAKKRNKTRIASSKRDAGSRVRPAPSYSRIDMEQIKKRYGGKALPDEEEVETEIDETSATVRGSRRELNVFGEDDKREQLRKRRMYAKLAAAFTVVLLITAAVTLYFLLIIDEIRVVGNETLEKADVLTASKINIGDHMLFIDTAEAQQNLMSNSSIRKATVKRSYPDTLVITIEERKPVAAIVGSGSYAVIDIEGYVMDITGAANDKLVSVYGLSSSGFAVNEKLGDYSAFNSEILLEILTGLSTQNILGIIDSIDMSQPLKIGMMTSYGYSVNIGQPENITDKLSNLSVVLAKVQEMGYVSGTIDLGVLGAPVYSPPKVYDPEEDTAAEDTPEAAPEGGDAATGEGAAPAA